VHRPAQPKRVARLRHATPAPPLARRARHWPRPDARGAPVGLAAGAMAAHRRQWATADGILAGGLRRSPWCPGRPGALRRAGRGRMGVERHCVESRWRPRPRRAPDLRPRMGTPVVSACCCGAGRAARMAPTSPINGPGAGRSGPRSCQRGQYRPGGEARRSSTTAPGPGFSTSVGTTTSSSVTSGACRMMSGLASDPGERSRPPA